MVVAAVLVFCYQQFAPKPKDDPTLRKMMDSYDEFSYKTRSIIASSPVFVLLAALLWRVWEIVTSDAYGGVVEGGGGDPPLPDRSVVGGHYIVCLSEVMPTWFMPFWFVDDYKMHIAVVPLRLTKLLFISAFILSVPFCLIALHYMTKPERPILTLMLWLIRKYYKWSSGDCSNHLHRIIYLEYAEEQYLRTIVKATLARAEKEKEVEELEEKMETLQENLAEANRWMHSERKLAHNSDRKNREMEKKLQSEKRKLQLFESRCRELERNLDSEKKSAAAWERKFNDVQKRLNLLEKRPVIRQQLSADDIMCVICMERKRQYLLRPCNHYCVCNTCKSTLQNKCPLCRKHIRSYEKIYIS